MRKIKSQLLLALAIVPIICTSCQIMPAEEEFPAAPVIRSYEAKEYTQTSVIRGDMILSKTVSCTYVPAKREKLSFSMGGAYIESIYVSEGQQVQKGDLLAELEQNNLREQISTREYELKVLKLKKSHVKENRDLDLKRQDAILAGIEEGQRENQEQQKASIKASYAEQLQDIEDSIYILELRLEELKTELKERRIYAPIDGTVTYVRAVKDGQRSVKGEYMITVSDMDTIVFTVQGEDAAYFPVGTQVSIQCRKKEFLADAVEPSELGLIVAPEQEVAYLKLTQPDPTLEDGVKGSIELTLEERRNVLYINKKAVKMANGEQFVYMLDEDGMKVMQTVTTGLESGGYIEITTGLSEGESVILD